MSTRKRWLFSLVVISMLISTAMGGDFDNPIFRAMSDELERSINELFIEGMPKPYFLSYQVREDQIITIEARYGSLLNSERTSSRTLSIDIRVGSPELDNTNYYADWQDVWNYRKELVEEDNYRALRHQIWYHTDHAYKAALENLAHKKAYLQANPPNEEIPDFTSAQSFTHLEDRPQLMVDQTAWEKIIRESSHAFENYPILQDWHVKLTTNAVTKWYMNSEGSRYRKGGIYHILEISATVQAEDGERLTGFLQYLTPIGEEPPKGEELAQNIRELAVELEAMAGAPPLDEYAGPVLFTDQAAAQFMSKLFVGQLTLPREALTADKWMNRYLPTGKLAGRVKRRIFPDFVTVTDEPQREKWGGMLLAGHMIVDDEGVPSQRITLVENGRLMTLPLGRQPTRKITGSNGHGRMLPNQMTVPGITNLIVSTSEPVKMQKMISKLRRLCRDYDTEYGLLVKQIDEPYYSLRYRTTEGGEESESLLPRPTIVYKVYANDGRMEPVRGLTFDEVSIRNLRDIVAMGRDSRAYNITQEAVFSHLRYPASIVTPSILVEEMELKAGSFQEPLPIAGNPMFR